jgi:CRISPR-associated protein Cas2
MGMRPAESRYKATLPSRGQVRVITVTDCQFAKMEIYVRKKRKATEDPAMQIMLF